MTTSYSEASPESDQDTAILLTVLIPTRNRAHRVAPLVKTFLAKWPKRYRSCYEIVVLNNCSTDTTLVDLESIQSDKLRVVTTEIYHPTSEENVFAGIERARGEFIWFFGDDDIPRFAAVESLLDLVQAGAADFFVSNFRVVDRDGRVASLSQVRGAPENYFGNLSEIVTRIGMINMLSGWSIIVARRSMLDVARAHEIRQISPIYAHCFWFLSCFSGAKAAFLTLPLVDYRVFHSTDGWTEYTAANDVGYLHYWHIGLLRLLKMAMKQNLLSADDISKIYEYRHNGSKYRAVNEIAYKIIEQAEVYWDTQLKRDLIGKVELSEALGVLTEIDLGLLDVSYCIRSMYEILWSDLTKSEAEEKLYRGAHKAAVNLLWDRNDDLYEPFFVEMIYGYCVYHYGDLWIGLRADAMNLIDKVFSQFTPRAIAPGVLVSKSHSELLEEIHLMEPTIEPVGPPPSPQEVSMVGKTNDLKGTRASGDDQYQDHIAMIGERDIYIEKLTGMVGERDRYIQTLTAMVGERDAAYASLSKIVNQRGEAPLWRRALRRLAS